MTEAGEALVDGPSEASSGDGEWLSGDGWTGRAMLWGGDDDRMAGRGRAGRTEEVAQGRNNGGQRR